MAQSDFLKVACVVLLILGAIATIAPILVPAACFGFLAAACYAAR